MLLGADVLERLVANLYLPPFRGGDARSGAKLTKM